MRGTLGIGAWLMSLPLFAVGGMLLAAPALAQNQDRSAPGEAAKQQADAEAERIWNEYIPGLAGHNTVRRERNRAALVRLGEEALPHLERALSTPRLLEELHEANQLAGLREYVQSDLQAWLERNAERLNNLPRMRRLVNGYRRFVDNDRLYHGMRHIYDAMDEMEDDATRPELLNSIRAFAALAIGEIGGEQHAAEISRLLQDGSRDVRARATQALGLLRASEYAEEIEPFLFARGDIFLRSCAWAALRRMDSRETVTRLIGELAGLDPQEEEPRQRLIVQALEGITLRNFGSNAGLWQRWWANAQQQDDPLRLQLEAGN